MTSDVPVHLTLVHHDVPRITQSGGASGVKDCATNWWMMTVHYYALAVVILGHRNILNSCTPLYGAIVYVVVVVVVVNLVRVILVPVMMMMIIIK